MCKQSQFEGGINLTIDKVSTTQLNLSWKGDYDMEMETPKDSYGKCGLFVITHNLKMIYIGKAGRSNSVFYESKRVNKCIKMLKEHGDIAQALSSDDSREYVHKHCRRFVGILSDEAQRSDLLNGLLMNAEKLLIYEVNRTIRLYNKHYLKEYSGEKPFTVTNSGNRPPRLEGQYSTI
jgi:hypothetical protein